MKNNKGFTLAELLIVVAIIAVLVAISIPIFTKQLEKSRESVDIANMRNAYALISVSVLTEDNIDGTKITDFSETMPAYYDISGKLTKTMPAAYGRGTATNGGTLYSACNDYSYNAGTDYRCSVITVWYDGAKVHVHWDNAASGNGGNTGTGGGSTGGGSSSGGGNTGGSTGGETGEDTNHDSVRIVDYPVGEFKGELGTIYKFENKLYVCVYPDSFKAGGAPTTWYTAQFVPISSDSKILTAADIKTKEWGEKYLELKSGYLYKDGNDYYISITDGDYAGPPNASNVRTDSNPYNGNWVKVKIE